MNRAFVDLDGQNVGSVSGPWWSRESAIDPEAEHAPEEAFFRIEFPAGGETKFRLATACFYQFWLNGRWIGSGPARASHGRLTVDEWTFSTEELNEQNTLAVQAFWEGIFTFDHVRGTPGLWYSVIQAGGEVAAQVLVSEKTGRQTTTRSSHQRGWIEEIDGRARTAGWPLGPWREDEWKAPVLRTQDPLPVLEARDIKAFAVRPVLAATVSFAGSGDLVNRTTHRTHYYAKNRGFAVPENSPSRVMQEEALEPALATDDNVSAITEGGEGVAVLGPDARGLDRTVQLHFAKLVTGTLELSLEAPAGTVIDIGWSEGRWNDADMGSWARSAQPGGSAPSQELNDARQALRFICAGSGRETFHSLFLVSLQDVRIAFRCPDRSTAIRLHTCRVFTRGYPIPQEGTFLCSDAALNRIHEAVVYTMSCSIDDVYMDCPGRERGGYPNDSYFASLGFLDTTGDLAFDRRFLRQFIDSQDGLDGVTAPCYPSDSSRWGNQLGRTKPYVITGHNLFWLLQCERHLRLTGDLALKEKWKPALVRTLTAINRYRSAEGLLENTPWDTYLDWSHFQVGPIQTGDNFLYALTLLTLGEFYGESEWVAQGRETAEAIDRLAWNAGRELYADTVVRQGETFRPSSAYSQVINYIAIWTGLGRPENAKRVWRQLRDFGPTKVGRHLFDYETSLVRANLVGLMYRFGYQAHRGELTELIHDLREAYEPMFARGQATLGEHLGYHGSLCHGYNAYVVFLMNRYLAGIELPKKRGGTIRIRPRPEILSWCQARTCWMDGHVQVWWSRDGDEVEILASVPAGQPGELVLGRAAPVPFKGTLHTKVAF